MKNHSVSPDTFLAAKDAAQEAFQANKVWHAITTAMLSAYEESRAAQPRTITNMEELGALPGETVIKATDGNVYEQNTLDPRMAAQWVATGSKYPVVTECAELPASVLRVPPEGDRP